MKIKNTLLTIAFIAIVSLANAQDKFDFAYIEFRTVPEEIFTSLNGKEFIVEKANYLGQSKKYANANPFLNKVIEFQGNGWEIMSLNNYGTASGGQVFAAYLKKKQGEKK
jgi:hypothetical protein